MKLLYDQVGITQERPDGARTQLTWEQVTSVYAHKQDCFAFDQVRLVIGNDSLKCWIEITEEDLNYSKLILDLPQHLTGFPLDDEWFQRVAQPPLETQWTKIFSRSSSQTGRH